MKQYNSNANPSFPSFIIFFLSILRVGSVFYTNDWIQTSNASLLTICGYELGPIYVRNNVSQNSAEIHLWNFQKIPIKNGCVFQLACSRNSWKYDNMYLSAMVGNCSTKLNASIFLFEFEGNTKLNLLFAPIQYREENKLSSIGLENNVLILVSKNMSSKTTHIQAFHINPMGIQKYAQVMVEGVNTFVLLSDNLEIAAYVPHASELSVFYGQQFLAQKTIAIKDSKANQNCTNFALQQNFQYFSYEEFENGDEISSITRFFYFVYKGNKIYDKKCRVDVQIFDAQDNQIFLYQLQDVGQQYIMCGYRQFHNNSNTVTEYDFDYSSIANIPYPERIQEIKCINHPSKISFLEDNIKLFILSQNTSSLYKQDYYISAFDEVHVGFVVLFWFVFVFLGFPMIGMIIAIFEEERVVNKILESLKSYQLKANEPQNEYQRLD